MNKLFIEAEGGNAEAQAKAAELCFVTSDHNGAWKLANLSAAQGNPLGLYALGMCYINGYNTAKNVEKARQLFQESADHGCPRALTGLAAVYAEDGRPFCREAVELIRKAAEAKDAKGLYMLSLLHKDGIRAVRSLRKYHSLLTQAAASSPLTPISPKV